jgi:hypothetical protein
MLIYLMVKRCESAIVFNRWYSYSLIRAQLSFHYLAFLAKLIDNLHYAQAVTKVL